jgi:hypothetical protein
LNHHERDQHDPENRGDHEQDAAGDVSGHSGFYGPGTVITDLVV